MTRLKTPFLRDEKAAIDEAFATIVDAVGFSTPRLAVLLQHAESRSAKEFANRTIGRIHVIEGFVAGAQGTATLESLHRQHDGRLAATIVGAGFRDHLPDFDLTRVFESAKRAVAARDAWRMRLSSQ